MDQLLIEREDGKIGCRITNDPDRFIRRLYHDMQKYNSTPKKRRAWMYWAIYGDRYRGAD